MLRLALVFLVVAIVAAFCGALRVEYISSQIAWVLFVIFLVLALVSFVFNGYRGRTTPPI